mmetsp:Transcript_19082/g.34596  ORF Transcript_19082/g.34596 Transcript_19082/m.34596 type:complete len:601 (-) Transcript_19082:114-1916(-)|eukprot:CAMPEP_0198299494 /NCGR_PEP_ID=MMETSP1449-20131203/44962_1 /TAXON_ID=420275 /ORGANISM="Attheya septentrionalis, Strain CCMP2084" /LENGTH=600 /DNA_ID=CAMNT_0044001067 /DNA_START=33 /DNA_END=1835 /DNA_ORIENTATION=+
MTSTSTSSSARKASAVPNDAEGADTATSNTNKRIKVSDDTSSAEAYENDVNALLKLDAESPRWPKLVRDFQPILLEISDLVNDSYRAEGFHGIKRKPQPKATLKDLYIQRVKLLNELQHGKSHMQMRPQNWCPLDGYQPKSLDSYEFVVNFWTYPPGCTNSTNRDLQCNTILSIPKLEALLTAGSDCKGGRGPCKYRKTSFLSSLEIDLSPFKDVIWPLVNNFAHLEVLVREKATMGSNCPLEGLFYHGSPDTNDAGLHCKSRPYAKHHTYTQFAAPSWFGDQSFEDDWDFEDENRMDARKRPWIPFTYPLFHMKEDTLTLYLDVKWGGKPLCDAERTMGERDILTFLEKGIIFRPGPFHGGYQPRDDDDVMTQTEKFTMYKTASRMPQYRSNSEEGTGWATFEYDYNIWDSFSFLVDFCVKNPVCNGSAQGSDIVSILIEEGSAASRDPRGRLNLSVPQDESKRINALLTSTSTCTDSQLIGAVTVIDNRTGKQAPLFVGDLDYELCKDSTAKYTIKSRHNFPYFDGFSSLSFFSTDKDYSAVTVAETKMELMQRDEEEFKLNIEILWKRANGRGQTELSMSDGTYQMILLLTEVLTYK